MHAHAPSDDQTRAKRTAPLDELPAGRLSPMRRLWMGVLRGYLIVVNGWNFWECKLPGESTWRVMASLRDS
jgi:hypothetical protein